MSGGGGGGTSTTTQSIPDELKPLASAYTNKAIGVSNQDYNPYGGQRNADLNTTQNLGIGMVQNRALNGDPTINAGSNFLQRSLNSGPQGATQNYVGGVTSQNNPYAGSIKSGSNPYAGPNPYLDQQVNKAQQSVANNFNTMIKPQTESSMVNSGSFGNSGLEEQMQNQQKAAAMQMSDIANNMYGGAYNNSAQLAESGANRDMQAQQANAQLGESGASRNLQAQQFNSQLGENFASRNDASRQNYMTNNLQAAGQGLQYGNQAYTDAAQLGKAGQIQQDQNQNNFDFNYQQFQDASNLPYKQLAAMSGALGTNMGGSSTTKSSGGGK